MGTMGWRTPLHQPNQNLIQKPAFHQGTGTCSRISELYEPNGTVVDAPVLHSGLGVAGIDEPISSTWFEVPKNHIHVITHGLEIMGLELDALTM